MVEILELPIQSKMKDKFIQFLEFTKSKQDDWNFEGIISSVELKEPNHKYVGVSDSCNVCLHGLKSIVIFRNKNTNEYKGLGTICGANLIAIQKYEGDIDKLNYDRMVKLEKKTIIKRMLEHQAKMGKIILESKYYEEMNWLYELIEEAKIRYEDYFLGHYHNDSTFSSIYRNNLDFYISIYNQVERKGKLSTKQIDAIRKNMNKQSIEERFTKLDNILKETWIKVAKKRIMEIHHGIIQNLITPFKHKLNSWQRDVISDLNNWYINNGYYSEKQMGLILKIASQVEEKYVEYIEQEKERWEEQLEKIGAV